MTLMLRDAWAVARMKGLVLMRGKLRLWLFGPTVTLV